MKKEYILLIDFDSTFVSVESLDHLAHIALRGRIDRKKVLDEIVEITKKGMEGTISFPQSLAKRLKLFKPNKVQIDELIIFLKQKVTPSLQRNKLFFKENAEKIYILSGGFKEYMIPVLREYGILESHILGNTFLFDKKGNVIGYDKNNHLVKKNGKVKMIQSMHFNHPIIVVGDGYTDYEIKQAKYAHMFLAFIENVKRDVVVKHADAVVRNFEEVLHHL